MTLAGQTPALTYVSANLPTWESYWDGMLDAIPQASASPASRFPCFVQGRFPLIQSPAGGSKAQPAHAAAGVISTTMMRSFASRWVLRRSLT